MGEDGASVGGGDVGEAHRRVGKVTWVKLTASG
jgi:hypothetical protein